MRHNLRISAGFLLIVGGGLTLLASNVSANSGGGITSSDLQATTYPGDVGRFERASRLMGVHVVDRNHQSVGRVTDVLANVPSGRAPLVVVSTDTRDKLVAVPSSFGRLNQRDGTLVLNVDKQTIDSAPSFTENNWPNVANPAWSEQVYSYYGHSDPSHAMAYGFREATGASVPLWAGGREQDEYANAILRRYQMGKTQARITDSELRVPNGGHLLRTSSSYTRETPSGYMRESSGSALPAATATSAQLSRSSDLIGTRVRDINGKSVGSIRDVVFDLSSSRIAYAALALEGSTTDRYYAIPPTALSLSTHPRTLVLNMDKEKLNSGPSFSGPTWPDPTNQSFLTDTYRYYGQTPYWQTR